LNEQAWRLVNPDARVPGREIEAVGLARQAVDSAREQDRPSCRLVLAWAFLWAGKVDEAMAEGRHAIEDMNPGQRFLGEIYLRRMEAAVKPFRDGTASARREALVAEVAALGREVAERRTFRFDDREKEWWNIQVSELVKGLEELARRIALAERSLTSPEAKARWSEAIEAIARSEEYRGLPLTPQLELLPLGPDPNSGLWEFAHLGTGEPAVRGSDGKLVLQPETGIVFVLLPSGRVPVEEGAESIPMNEVLLDPYFLSKYEITVSQWRRTSSWTRRFWREESLMPANGMSWDDCVSTLESAGLFLRLPTEAQWEYACRAGTTTPWWTGASKGSLQGAANINLETGDNDYGLDLEPVGQLSANPFGLHDVHGNLLEWCSDGWSTNDVPVRPGDGEHKPTGSRDRVIRGGAFVDGTAHARSSSRVANSPEFRGVFLGLRVARSVTP
jgi:formylglycine-generating enzyme required for sulfatase activity